jgi:hypothetical protein
MEDFDEFGLWPSVFDYRLAYIRPSLSFSQGEKQYNPKMIPRHTLARVSGYHFGWMAHHHCLAWVCSDSACGAVGGVADPQPAGKRFSFCVNGVSPWFRVGMGLTAPAALLGGVTDPQPAGKRFFI